MMPDLIRAFFHSSRCVNIIIRISLIIMLLIHEAILIRYTYINDFTYYCVHTMYNNLIVSSLQHKVMNRLILRESGFYIREHVIIIISLMIIIKLHNVY